MKTLKDFFNSIRGGEFLEEINNNRSRSWYGDSITRSDVYQSASDLLEDKLDSFIKDKDKYSDTYEIISNRWNYNTKNRSISVFLKKGNVKEYIFGVTLIVTCKKEGGDFKAAKIELDYFVNKEEYLTYSFDEIFNHFLNVTYKVKEEENKIINAKAKEELKEYIKSNILDKLQNGEEISIYSFDLNKLINNYNKTL